MSLQLDPKIVPRCPCRLHHFMEVQLDSQNKFGDSKKCYINDLEDVQGRHFTVLFFTKVNIVSEN